MKRSQPIKIAVVAVVVLILTFAAGWAVGDRDECEQFMARVEGYVAALEDQGIPQDQIAPLSSAALSRSQPAGCDVL